MGVIDSNHNTVPLGKAVYLHELDRFVALEARDESVVAINLFYGDEEEVSAEVLGNDVQIQDVVTVISQEIVDDPDLYTNLMVEEYLNIDNYSLQSDYESCELKFAYEATLVDHKDLSYDVWS